MNSTSASGNINRRTRKLVVIILALTGVTLVGVGVLFGLSLNQMKTFKKVTKEWQSQQLARASSQQLLAYVAANESAIQEFMTVFPMEEDMLAVITELEALVQEYDPQGSVKFASTAPGRVSTQLVIPLIIKVNISAPETIALLRQVEKLPYIVETNSVELKTPAGLAGKGEVMIGARLYVADPFR